MAATTKININTDIETKQAAEKIFEALGMNMTTAINVFLKKAIEYKGIPFDVCIEIPNATTIAAMDEYDEMKKNPSAYKKYATFKDALNEVL